MRESRLAKTMWILSLVLTLALVVLPLSAPAGSAQAQGSDFKLTLLHTNDVHAHIQPFDVSGGACAPGADCFGGVARRATAIQQIRARGGNVLLVDAGDQFQGTLFYNQYKGQDAETFMNMMGYQAMAIGNHEFDDGPAILGQFIQGVKFPVLAANLDVSAEPTLANLVKPWTVVEVGGEKIGLFGLTTEELPQIASPGPNVKVNPVVDSAKAAVKELEGRGVNKIVALTHIGYTVDQSLAAAVDGIDVIVGGHSHTLLSNTDKTASGPYPTVVKSPNGNPVLIVTDGYYGKALGDFNVTFDANGVAKSWSGEPLVLHDGVPQDATAAAKVTEMYSPIEALQKTAIGQAAVALNGDRKVCRFEECNLGDLVADAIVWKSQNDGTQIAFMNSGGIRASIAAMTITVGNVLEVLPFGNTVATFGLKGSDVLAALENSVSQAENPDNPGTGRFMQVSGLRFSWDSTRPVGSRVVSVEVGTKATGFKPLDPNATYQCASNDFNRKGGDGFDMFAKNAIDPYDYGPLAADALGDYIKAHSPVSAEVEGRITKVK